MSEKPTYLACTVVVEKITNAMRPEITSETVLFIDTSAAAYNWVHNKIKLFVQERLNSQENNGLPVTPNVFDYMRAQKALTSLACDTYHPPFTECVQLYDYRLHILVTTTAKPIDANQIH